ncbi:sulfatase [Labilibacter sediminis]|nr:sulfatase [Labilibacter sediminis]
MKSQKGRIMKLRYKAIMISLLACVWVIQAQKQPNVLFIMSDDHTTQAIGAYNSMLAKLNPTPVLDKIAKEGIVMENAFCHNAICTPSRACIMTGQYSSINGIVTLSGDLPKEKQYLALEMKKAGYSTAVVGKWHLHDRPEAFDYYKVLPGQGYYFDPVFFEKGIESSVKVGRKDFGKGSVQMNGHSSDCIAESALSWLKDGRDQNKPFFLKLHFKAPHGKWEYAPRYKDYLEDVEIPEPANLWDTKNNGSIATKGYNGELEKYIGTSVGRRNVVRNYTQKHPMWEISQSVPDKEAKAQAYQAYLKSYLRCVKGVDDNLKKVVDYLKEIGEYDNTVIMYTGDQGFFLGEHDYVDKRWGYEESMRMPFIVRYPKTIKAGSSSNAIVENVDYAPTILDFAGLTTPEYMQGRSFKNILENKGKEPEDWKDAAYYHYQLHMAHHMVPAHMAIRTKEYKLILFYGTHFRNKTIPDSPPAWELYDLKNDPTEDNNVFDDPKYAQVVKELKVRLKEMRHQYKVDGEEFAYNKVINDYWDYDEEAKNKSIEVSHDMLKRIENQEYHYFKKYYEKQGKVLKK